MAAAPVIASGHSLAYLTSDTQFSQALPLKNSLTREETGKLLNWFIANKQTKLLLQKICHVYLTPI